MFEVDVSQIKQAATVYHTASGLLDDYLSAILDTAASEAAATTVALVRSVTRVNTGKLRDSTRPEISGTGDTRVVSIVQDAESDEGKPYVGFVLEGNAPEGGDGYIYPKHGEFLFWPGADHPVRRVRAFAGDDYMATIQPGIDTATGIIASQSANRGGNYLLERLRAA